MNTPMGGDDFPSPGADYDPDSAMMQARATRELQRQMRWLTDLLSKYEEEILISGDGQRFTALADVMGTNPQFQRKWLLEGSPDRVTLANPGGLRSGLKFNTSISINNLDGEFDLSTVNDRLYLEGQFVAGQWQVSLKGDQSWSDANPVYFDGSEYTYTHWYYPLAITHSLSALEADGVTPALSNENVGIRLVAPDSDLTLSDSYFINEETYEGQYMIYPFPPPGDIYLP